ncbi:MAG: hypothetical protein PVF58_06385 [Candidatus Methanofastidiosia archaeon]
MCIFTQDRKHELQHCMYQIYLGDPRLLYREVAEECNSCRNTISKYWEEGLENQVFFPPQIRLNMYENRKEYIYFIQSDSAQKLYFHFKNHPDLVYIAYCSGNFDIFLQLSAPLDVLPDRTLFYGSRSNYIYPPIPLWSYEFALLEMEASLNTQAEPSKIPVEYPPEPSEVGSSHYGWMIFPYIKYDLKVTYTFIVKTLHISYESFHKGLDYLMNVSTKLLPFYPLGYNLYSQFFFVFWSDYEEFLCKLFSYLPCHTSITKVNDALVVWISIEKGEGFSQRFFQFCFKLQEAGFINRFWSSRPIFHWKSYLP